MKYMHSMNNNIDKYSALKEEKSSWILIAAAIAAVIIMLIVSFIPQKEPVVPESETIEMEFEG